jgi:bud site selection protein 20
MTRYSRKKGAQTKKKGFRKSRGTKRRAVDIDQIQDELKHGTVKAGATREVRDRFDPDLPGGGNFYCVETGRHFQDAHALAEHKKTKGYKKRLKLLKEKQYTQEEADAAAGLGKEAYVPYGDAPTNTANAKPAKRAPMVAERLNKFGRTKINN